MIRTTDFYIDGAWVSPEGPERIDVVDPATETVVAQVSQATDNEVDRAVRAARRSFDDGVLGGIPERVDLMRRIVERYTERLEEFAQAISTEMGSPITFARQSQAASLIGQFEQAITTVEEYDFDRVHLGARLLREPIGVTGLITAWNWPINLIAGKLAYALAAGCTVVLKPSEVAPLSPLLLASVMDEVGTPAGVFNLVNGDGARVGRALCEHPLVDMISFTGSTRGGIAVARAAADTVKRVHQELGGKSANIVLHGADLEAAMTANVRRVFGNAGQSCQAPTRVLVPRAEYEEALRHAKAAAEATIVGDPSSEATMMGPVANEAQYDRVQELIRQGVDAGARIVTGGLGHPEGLERGYFVKPTILGDVDNSMSVAQEEIFGPVLPIIAYDTPEDAVTIANDTRYGLANYIQTTDADLGFSLASQLRSGRVYINTMEQNASAPFGGYKQSGNGREGGEMGLEEFLETKAVLS